MDEGDEGERVTPNQTDSSPIKPNQTKSNLSEGKMDLPEANEGGGMPAGQTQSNTVKPEKDPVK
jgi:hypothetical protein